MNRMFIMLCLSINAVAYADIYRWVDEYGTVHFSERPPMRTDATTLPQTEKMQVQMQNIMPASRSTSASKPDKSPIDKKADSFDWEEYDRQDKALRIQNAKKIEQREARARKKEEQCVMARQQLRALDMRTYTDTSLAALQKRRQQKDRVQAQIRDRCY